MANDGAVVRQAKSISLPGAGAGQLDGVELLRQRLALALDFDDTVIASRWATRMRPWFGVAKVGLELFSAAGPPVVAELMEAGFSVFVDMKLADIPTTTRTGGQGARGSGRFLPHDPYLCRPRTLMAGVEGLAEGADRAGLPAPVALGITILTSDADAPPELVRARVAAARDAGCGGVVSAASDLREAKAVAPGLLAVVPGIRLAGTASDDQSRSATPADAMRAGADMLVIGRAVTAAPVPEAAAASIVEELTAVLAR